LVFSTFSVNIAENDRIESFLSTSQGYISIETNHEKILQRRIKWDAAGSGRGPLYSIIPEFSSKK
jgi:hypothetical protein